MLLKPVWDSSPQQDFVRRKGIYRSTAGGGGRNLQEAERSPRGPLRKSNYTDHHRSPGRPRHPELRPDEGGLLQLSGHLDEWAPHTLRERWEETRHK